jgi:hypothetical protein
METKEQKERLSHYDNVLLFRSPDYKHKVALQEITGVPAWIDKRRFTLVVET